MELESKQKYPIGDSMEHLNLVDFQGKPKTITKSSVEHARKSIYYFLERPESKIAISYHVVNLVLIVGSILTSILSTIDTYENNEILKDLIFYYELSLLSWFTVEYGLRVWSCSFLGKYKGVVGKLKFIKTLYMMIDAFVIISTLTTAILSIKTAYFTILRITRFLQIFRILRLDRQRGDLRTMGRVVYKHRKELVTCYFVGFIILFGSTYLIYIIEKSSATDSTIDNMANGLYWAMITVTSVGYGDISPETWAGKLLTGVFALVGCAFFALPAGILGSGFALQVAKQKKQRRFIKVRNPAAIAIQTCWRNYAVMTNKYQLQGTWYYFFPQILGRTNKPEYYEILPGVQEILHSDFFPHKIVDKIDESSGKSKKMSRKRSARKMIRNLFQNGDTSTTTSNGFPGDNNKPHTRKRRSSKGTLNRKKTPFEMPISTILNKQYKDAIRFILRVKLFCNIKTFKNVRYPFVNVQDIMEKNAMCHTETLSYLNHIQESLKEFRQELKAIRAEMRQYHGVAPAIRDTDSSDSSSDDDGDGDNDDLKFIDFDSVIAATDSHEEDDGNHSVLASTNKTEEINNDDDDHDVDHFESENAADGDSHQGETVEMVLDKNENNNNVDSKLIHLDSDKHVADDIISNTVMVKGIPTAKCLPNVEESDD